MISVLLADDNKYALQHFAHLVDWEALGFSLAGTAVDGNEAWEVFQEILPQVVITDVQMPGLDGKELAKLIKKAAPETIVIFLSSYDVFDYARAAVDLSVYEYILKHELDRETLTDRLAQIRSQLEEKDARKHRLIRGYLAASFGMPFEDPAQAAFEDQYLADKACECFVLEQDHVPDFLALSTGIQVQEPDYGGMQISDIVQQCPGLQDLVRVVPFRLVGICEPGKAAYIAALQAQKRMQELAGGSYSVFLIGKARTVKELRGQYETYREWFDQRYFEKSSALMRLELYDPPQSYHDPRLEELYEELARGGESVLPLFDDIFCEYLYHRDYHTFTSAAAGVLHRLNVRIREWRLSVEMYDEEVRYLLTARRLIRWLRDKIVTVMESERTVYSPVISRAIRCIETRYMDSTLGVEDIAVSSGLSVNRLNDLFKKEVGDTVGRYLTHCRMKKAQKLLENGTDPVPQVAAETGYTSASYFSRVFRRMFGVAPQEYQRMKREEKRYGQE